MSSLDQPDQFGAPDRPRRSPGVRGPRPAGRERSARMKLIRFKQFQIMTTGRLVDQIDATIADLRQTADGLERDIRVEEN